MGYAEWGVVATDIEIDSELFTPYRITNYELRMNELRYTLQELNILHDYTLIPNSFRIPKTLFIFILRPLVTSESIHTPTLLNEE